MKNLDLYNKYVNNLTKQKNGSYSGDSPFEDGKKITITKSGIFKCKASKNSGDIKDFLKLLYPKMTDVGINKCVKLEQLLTPQQLESIQKSIESFKRDPKRMKVASEKLHLPVEFLKSQPGFMSTREFQYMMVDHFSPNGTPLVITTFSLNDPLARTQGVPRLDEKLSKQVFFVENPLVAAWVTKHFKRSAFIWPKQDDLPNYDYKELLKGKEVDIIYDDLKGPYDQSFLPFAETIQPSVQSLSTLKYRDFCHGSSFVKWITSLENQKVLLEKAEKRANKPLIPQDVYEKSINSEQRHEVPFPQAYAKGFFFYGRNDGRIVQSNPIDVHTVEEVEKKFKVTVLAPSAPDRAVKLTPSTILSINESIANISPQSTYEALKQFIGERIYFGENQHDLELLTLWILGTYVFQMFNAYPYLHLKGKAGTGKTTTLEITEHTSFNGVIASKVTNARLMNEINDSKCTLCLDEFEKSSGSQSSASTQILNAGYKKSGRYLRMMGDSDKDQHIDLYSPKAYASISDIKTDSLTSRTLPIHQLKAPSKMGLTPWDPEDKYTKQQITAIIEGGYAIGLYHHHYIEYLIATMPNKILLPNGLTLEGRQRELSMPILVMANLFDSTGGLEDIIKDVIQSKLTPGHQDTLRRVKLFTNQLNEWGSDLSSLVYATDKEKVWISNQVWETTSLLDEFGGKNKSLYDWLRSLSSDIEIESKWMPDLKKPESSIGIPLNLNLNKKEIRSWLKLESQNAA